MIHPELRPPSKAQPDPLYLPQMRGLIRDRLRFFRSPNTAKQVLGIMAAILASLHMQTADDLFGGPQGSPRSDKLIAASVQWAEKIMEKIDNVFRSSGLP